MSLSAITNDFRPAKNPFSTSICTNLPVHAQQENKTLRALKHKSKPAQPSRKAVQGRRHCQRWYHFILESLKAYLLDPAVISARSISWQHTDNLLGAHDLDQLWDVRRTSKHVWIIQQCSHTFSVIVTAKMMRLRLR